MPKATAKNQQAAIEGEVMDALSLQRKLDDTESELMLDPRFKQYLALRDEVNQTWERVRKEVADIMIPAYTAGQIDKTIKGDWGTITVSESDEFTADVALLPKDLKKVVPEMGKIKDFYHLHGKVPKGATYTGKKYGITMRFKKEGK